MFPVECFPPRIEGVLAEPALRMDGYTYAFGFLLSNFADLGRFYVREEQSATRPDILFDRFANSGMLSRSKFKAF